MRTYEKPMALKTEGTSEGVYLASGEIVGGRCGSIYLKGVFHKPNHSGNAMGTNIDVRGCEGCPGGDDGNECKILKGEYWSDKDYRPTWERNGEAPDKMTW